ncbi:MAG: hypothetical protein E6772_07265 [Dysgonomonas sp.]|nr:hypothetical protein [Dysgonomonas sp.]
MRGVIFILSVLFIFSSCESDSSTLGSSNIVGYWEFSHALLNEVVTGSDEDTRKIENVIRKYTSVTDWSFHEGGIAYEYDWEDEIRYLYSIKGKILTMTYSPEDSDYPYVGEDYEYDLSGNTLIKYVDETRYFKEDYPKMNISKVMVAFVYNRK